MKELLGCKVYENGDIIGVNGIKLKKGKSLKVKMEDGKYHTFSYGRFVYKAFNPTFDFDNKKIRIVTKNGESFNFAINNLEEKTVSQIRESGKKLLNDEQKEKIGKKYLESQEKGQGINCPNKKVSYRSLAKEYYVSFCTIRDILKNHV